MYSVEDLLISHGYKPSRNPPAPRKDDPERHRAARTRSRAGQGLVNGCEDGPAAYAHSRTSLGAGHVNDCESRRSTPLRGHGERQSTSASRTSEAGYYDRPILAWSSQPQIGTDHVYWRRGGQEGRGWIVPGEQQVLGIRGMAQAHSLPVHMREGPWEVAGRTEHVMKKATWEEELRMPAPAKWQSVSSESWKQPRKLGRQVSDGDGEKLSQELYPFIQGAHMLSAQNRKKSRSLPRVLSPENLNFTEVPVPLQDGRFPGVPKMPLETTRNPEKSVSSSGPFPRPKFGRPVKPPSYSSHPQCREGADHQHLDLRGSFPNRSNDPRHEFGVLDPGLEPPVYVPPPSYRSPPQHIPNPYLEDPAPTNSSVGHSQQQPSPSRLLPSDSFAARSDFSASPGSPRGVPLSPRPFAAFEGSVQYIPFDDPRIRHIKLAQPSGLCEEVRLDGRPYNSGPMTTQEPAHGKRPFDSTLLQPQNSLPVSGNERGPTFANASPQWLWGQLPTERENGQTDQYDVSDSQHIHTTSPYPQDKSTCETQTKLRKFETGNHTKKSSKKKTSETIFCLVSVPVKSESQLPDTDTNNNDLMLSMDGKHALERSAALQEQSLLSTSSTDLELQALMGSMAGRRELLRPDLAEPNHEQARDFGFLHLTKLRELQSSGAWPGHQYRDQQTQTSFPDDSKSSQLLPVTAPGGSGNVAPLPPCLDPTAADACVHTTSASSNHVQKPSVPNLRGQASLSPSRNSAFSRTSNVNQAAVPKGGPGQPCVEVQGHVSKPEVVKGEPTAVLCNSKQLFGQFLLKPVSRRPWDLISQLESFNKELQEEEESHHGSSSGGNSSGEDSEEEPQPGDCADSRSRTWDCHETGQETRVGQWPRALVPEEPGMPAGRTQSKSESWREMKPGRPCPRPDSPGCSQTEGSRANAFQKADGSLAAEQQGQEVVNGTCELSVSPDPVSRTVALRPAATKAVPPTRAAEPTESQDITEFSDALGSVRLSRGASPEVDSSTERDTVVPLSLTDKNRGLSAPDLRSVGLTMGQEQSACKLDESLSVGGTVEIPPGESLHERAERILGIEVAVESLLRGARRAGQSQPPKPDASACSPKSPRKDPLPSSAPPGDLTGTTDAFYGRRKCGWTQSPLFVGERAPHTSECSSVDGVPASQANPELQLSPLKCKSSEEKDVGAKAPFRSTLFHVIERTPSTAGSEKRLRSPSKAIENLQEKLASPPRRVDPERLMRMKEVSSMSRMRCLSYRSADSMEEPEDPKVTRGQAWQPGSLSPLSSGDQLWQLPYASKGFVSRQGSDHPEVPREKKADQDFWCPETYDPSRVERV